MSVYMDAAGNIRVMTDEELALYDAAMMQGRYLDGLGIVGGAAQRQEEQERAERDAEREEFYAKLRIERPELFNK